MSVTICELSLPHQVLPVVEGIQVAGEGIQVEGACHHQQHQASLGALEGTLPPEGALQAVEGSLKKEVLGGSQGRT